MKQNILEKNRVLPLLYNKIKDMNTIAMRFM